MRKWTIALLVVGSVAALLVAGGIVPGFDSETTDVVTVTESPDTDATTPEPARKTRVYEADLPLATDVTAANSMAHAYDVM